MKKALFILFILINLVAKAQGDLTSLLETTHNSTLTNQQVVQRLNEFIKDLSASHNGETRQLRKVFKGLQSGFLKKYEAYSDFDRIFSTGHFDCLTATALFSNVLDQLHYSYDIIETNYHIFLVVQTSGGDVMIETTDRFDGFITNQDAIALRIQEYRKNVPAENHSTGYLYQYPFSLCQEISKENLGGLLYFNQAVKAYNQHNWLVSCSLLEKANDLYSSPRCEALGSLLIQTITESTMGEKEKADCMAHLKNFLARKSDLASN